MKVYKVTDRNMQTHNNCQWEINNSKETDGQGKLCSKHFLHFYHHPLIAALMHPMLYFNNPRLFEADADGITKNDRYRKGGCTKLTLTKEINLLQLTRTQRVACAILFAQQVCKDKKWNTWATNWLNKTDRTIKSAIIVRNDPAVAAYAYADFESDNTDADYKSDNTDADYKSDNTDADYYAAYYAANAAYDNVFDVAYAVYFAIEANPDTFTLENILNTITKALEY